MHLDDDLRKSHVLMFVDDRLLSKRKKSNFAGSRLPKTATCLINTAEPAE